MPSALCLYLSSQHHLTPIMMNELKHLQVSFATIDIRKEHGKTKAKMNFHSDTSVRSLSATTVRQWHAKFTLICGSLTVKKNVFIKHLLGCYSCHLYQAPLRVFCYTHRVLQLHPWGVEDILKENGVFSLSYGQSHFHQTISNIIVHIIDTKNIQETWICDSNTYIQYHQLFLPLMVFSLYL